MSRVFAGCGRAARRRSACASAISSRALPTTGVPGIVARTHGSFPFLVGPDNMPVPNRTPHGYSRPTNAPRAADAYCNIVASSRGESARSGKSPVRCPLGIAAIAACRSGIDPLPTRSSVAVPVCCPLRVASRTNRDRDVAERGFRWLCGIHPVAAPTFAAFSPDSPPAGFLARVTGSLRFQSPAWANRSNRFAAVAGRHSL